MLERSDTMSKKKQEFDITGMHCAACVKRVENVVSKIDGVESVKVNLLTRKGSVEYKDSSTVEPQQIIDAITTRTSMVRAPFFTALHALL